MTKGKNRRSRKDFSSSRNASVRKQHMTKREISSAFPTIARSMKVAKKPVTRQLAALASSAAARKRVSRDRWRRPRMANWTARRTESNPANIGSGFQGQVQERRASREAFLCNHGQKRRDGRLIRTPQDHPHGMRAVGDFRKGVAMVARQAPREAAAGLPTAPSARRREWTPALPRDQR